MPRGAVGAGILYTLLLALSTLPVLAWPLPLEHRIPLLAIIAITLVHGVLEPLYFLTRYPIDPSLTGQLERMGMPYPVVSRPGGASAGQAVGFLPHLRVVVVDAGAARLLGGLLPVLLAHEGAHLRHHHGLRYMALVTLLLLLTPLYTGAAEALAAWLAIMLATLLYATRRFEAGANRAARRLAGEAGYIEARALLRAAYSRRGRFFRAWYRLTHPED